MKIYQSIDPIGKVKELPTAYIRKIASDYEELTLRIINSGVIDILVKKNLFPKTTYHKKNKNLFLYHEKKQYCSKPKEWTFDMVKDAILTMLEVDMIIQQYGFTLKDFHFDNIVFSQGKAYFVDFGSIVDKSKNSTLYINEFINNVYPLVKARKSLYSSLRYISDEKKDRFFGIKFNDRLPLILLLYKLIIRVQNFLYWKCNIKYAKLKTIPYYYKKYIANIKAPLIHSTWENYHKNFIKNFDTPSQRFISLIEVVKGYHPETILDVAGNSGYFALLCAKFIPNIKNIYCCDCDYNAINSLYNFIKSNPEISNITPLLMNIVFPSKTTGDDSYSRLKSDVVCALAVTHHLFLSQYIDSDYFFAEIKKYTKKIAIIEFMPLGLYDGISTPPLPHWYTKEWFGKHFSRHFKKINEIYLEKNRIAFIGIPI